MGTELEFQSSGRRTDEPVTFTLDGERFWGRPELPGSIILENEALVWGAGRGVAAASIMQFFEHMLRGQFAPLPEIQDETVTEETTAPARADEFMRFRAFIDDPERMVQLEDVGAIYAALVREYTRRPTKRPSASPDGPQNTPDGSTEGSP